MKYLALMLAATACFSQTVEFKSKIGQNEPTKQLISAIQGLKSGEKLNVVLDSPGGTFGSGMAILESIEKTKGQVHVVIKNAQSMAALIPCVSHSFSVHPQGMVIMFHRAKYTGQVKNLQEKVAANFLEDRTSMTYLEIATKYCAPKGLFQEKDTLDFWAGVDIRYELKPTQGK